MTTPDPTLVLSTRRVPLGVESDGPLLGRFECAKHLSSAADELVELEGEQGAAVRSLDVLRRLEESHERITGDRDIDTCVRGKFLGCGAERDGTSPLGSAPFGQMKPQVVVSADNLNDFLGVRKYNYGRAEQQNQVGQVVGLTEIRELPLNKRDYTQLVLLAPGTAVNPRQRIGGAINVNGNRSLQNNYLLDGVNVNDLDRDDLADIRNSLQSLMWRRVGVERTGESLAEALGTVEGQQVVLGNAGFLAEIGVDVAALSEPAEALRSEGATAIFVAVDRRLAGVLAIADPVKPTTPAALASATQAARASGLPGPRRSALGSSRMCNCSSLPRRTEGSSRSRISKCQTAAGWSSNKSKSSKCTPTTGLSRV